jgi:hypothetical protein
MASPRRDIKGRARRDPVNRDALCRRDRRSRKLIGDFPEIAEMDLNPVFATKSGAIAADVRIVVDFRRPGPLPAKPGEIVAQMNRIMKPECGGGDRRLGRGRQDRQLGDEEPHQRRLQGRDLSDPSQRPPRSWAKKAYKSVKDVPGVIDVAVFAIPAKFVARR